MKKSQSIFSFGGNQKFLNQELLFFIENLQKKAVESGLEEDCLIPNKDVNDKKIFEYIKNNVISKEQSRPGSAITDHSSSFSNSLARTYKPNHPLES